ncbi:MAG: DNA recombination protein RmuC, partial [Planctomycetaceae bacterium]|nr:DNA recombination protein RmuC [Planctomycetaceae bacterium]
DRLRGEAGSAAAAEASAKALCGAAQAAAQELRAQVDTERTRADQEARLRAKTQEELRAAEERISEREQAMRRVLEEREKALAELRTSLEQSKAQLTDVFKSAGADVLRATAENLLRQAKEQFEGHKQLSQQELEARQKAIDATIAPLKDQLARQEELVKQLGEKREGDAKTLGEQLRQIAELQQKASSAAQTLSSALRDNRQRGQWGEISLRNIAELAGLVDDEGNRLRPDMTVRLPGGRFVPIDAKVPMNAYLDSLDGALSDADRALRRGAHAQALRSHMRALASRDYARALGGGVEITVLFVPLESGLIAALEEDATIYQEALAKGVIITTASTLLALLRTCAMQWQQAKLNENARRIGENAKELLDRIGKFAEHLEKVGSGLTSAAKSYNAAVGSFNTRLLPSARDTAELAGDLALAPEELPTTETSVREVAGAVRALPGA